MKRLLLFFLGIFLISMSTSAGPAQPQLIKDTQPDGTVIEYYLRGDEKINWMESPDGHTLLLDNDGRIVYALKNSEGDIEPSDIIYKNTQLKKSFDPRINAIPQKLFYSTSQVNSMLQIWNIEKEQVKGRALGTRPYTGEFRVLCVLVDFVDNPMTTENVKSKFEMLLNQRGYTGTLGNPAYGSVKDYFLENSYGKVNITFDVIGPYRAEEMSNYRGAGVYKVTNLSKLGKFLIKNKIQNESELDLSLYADPSGEINRLHIIYAGEDQAFAGLANGFAWSHQYGFGMGGSLEPGNPDDYDCVSSKDGQTYTFKRYSCSAELSPNMRNRDERKVSTIGTPTHELAHLLFESKDFYDGNGVYKGTGQWDLMAGGSHNYITDNFYTSMFYGNSPAHMNMYEKIRLGWVKPQVLTTSGSFSLENAAENPVAYIYQKGNNLTDFTSLENVQDDFFILENRQKKGFDAGLLNGPQYNGPLFQGGLLIYRVDKNIRNSSGPNYTYPQRIYPVCASSTYAFPGQIEGGNIVDSYGDINNIGCVFGNEYTSFTDETVPSAKTILEYSNGSVTSSTETGKPLTHIVNQDGIVTFRFGNLSNFKYHEDDKEGLRQLLRQGNNAIMAFRHTSVNDTLTWYESEEWVKQVSEWFIPLTWNNEIPKRITKIISSPALTPSIEGLLDCRYFQKIECLSAQGLEISQIIASELPFLKEVNASYLPLSYLDLSGSTSVEKLQCYYTYLKFSTLPDPAIIKEEYSYTPQYKIKGGEVNVGEIIDLSSEYNIKGSLTTYTWYNKFNQVVTLNSPENGKFIPDPSFRNEELTCKMSNAAFPDLVLEYSVKINNIYDEDDKEGLRQILRMPLEGSNKFVYEMVGLDTADTLTWYASQDWIGKITNYIKTDWNTEIPSRMTFISIYSLDIAGLLDCGNFKKLQQLDLYGTKISQLDISKNMNLVSLWCTLNPILELDLTQNLSLVSLNCSARTLTNIDVTNNKNLKSLICVGNPLSSLDISNNLLLEYLDIHFTEITQIDLSKNTKLKHFESRSTPIGNIDFSQNTELETISCYNSQMTILDISKNTKLKSLTCDDNYLKFSTLPIISPFKEQYHSQKPIIGEKTPSDQIIDLSSEYNINGNITNYYWREVTGTPVSVKSLGNGKFIAEGYAGKHLECLMSNDTFINLILTFRVEIIEGDIQLKDHLKVNLENNHSVNTSKTFQVYANTNVANPDEVHFGLYNPVNGDLRDSLIVLSRTNNVYTCQLRSQTTNSAYMLMPYIYKNGERKDIERTESSPWVDKLPIKVNEDIWGRSLTSYAPSEDVSANKYIQLNINNKVNELFEIDQFVPFKVYMPTTAPAEARIGLFYPNGTFYTDITNTRSSYTYTCEITDEVQDGNYIIMPYIKHEGKIKVVERTTGSKLMDRLPVKVNEVDIWGDDIWADTSLKVAFSEGADKNTSVSVVFEKASDILSIYAPTEVIQSEIYNMQGVLVKKVNQDSRFSLNNLHTGVYIVKVTTPQGISTHKIKKD